MKFNAQRKPGLYRRVGIACGLDIVSAAAEEADRQTIEFIQNLVSDLGLGGGLRAHGAKDAQIDALTAQAFADPCHATNPAPVTQSDLKALYQAAL